MLACLVPKNKNIMATEIQDVSGEALIKAIDQRVAGKSGSASIDELERAQELLEVIESIRGSDFVNELKQYIEYGSPSPDDVREAVGKAIDSTEMISGVEYAISQPGLGS